MAIKREEVKPQQVLQEYTSVYSESVKKSLAEKLFPFLVIVLIAMSFGLGSLWTKVKYLENGSSSLGTNTNTAAQQQQPVPVNVDINDIKALFKKNLVKFGDEKKKNLLVEVADPSCPFCHAAAGKNPELSKQMGTQFILTADGGTYVAPVVEMKKLVDSGQAGYVYIYSNGHGNGEVATKALYCAYDQGRFWQAHDKLMSNDGYTIINNVVKNDKTKHREMADFLAGAVNTSELKSCLDSGKYDSRIAEEQQLAASLGVSGTPGFFVNESNFAGAYSWNDMKGALK